MMRTLHYPPQPDAPDNNILGIGAHTEWVVSKPSCPCMLFTPFGFIVLWWVQASEFVIYWTMDSASRFSGNKQVLRLSKFWTLMNNGSTYHRCQEPSLSSTDISLAFHTLFFSIWLLTLDYQSWRSICALDKCVDSTILGYLHGVPITLYRWYFQVYRAPSYQQEHYWSLFHRTILRHWLRG